MASLELRNGTYRVVFRYGGQKFACSLKTSQPSEANLALARLEDNLRRVELGTLILLSGVPVTRMCLSHRGLDVPITGGEASIDLCSSPKPEEIVGSEIE